MSARPSLQRRLVVLVLTAVGAAMAVSMTIALWQQANNYSVMRRQALVATAQIFAAAVGPAVAAGRQEGAWLALRAIGRVPDIHYAEVRSADGRTLAAFGGAARLASDLSLTGSEEPSLHRLLTTGTIEVSVPVLNGGTPVGRFLLVGGISDLRAKLMTTAAFTAIGGALALVVGFAVAWRLQRRVTTPLRALLQAMGRVRQEHDYTVAVAEASDREIGELVEGFNRMLGDVRERDRRLEAHRQNLEHEVAARTFELRDARDAAETANRAKSEFLATMSHEIRTPMNGILVMAELLSQSELPRRQQRFAEVIARSGQSLLAIINDILDFSKIEAGKLELERVPVDLNALVENVTSLFSERARSKSIDLAGLVDPSVPRSILADPVRLGQIVSNLANNALKFTESGFVKIAVTKAAERIEIAVTDSGIGIAQDKLATIFDAFSQADQSTTRQFGGTGLGLAICRRLVEAMDGEISVTSRPRDGATFTVSIPAGAHERAPWPQLRLGPGALAFCVLDVAGSATEAALARYFAASGYAIVRRDERLDMDHCREAAAICVDAERLATYSFPAGERRPRILAVQSLGDASAEELVASGRADAVLTRPVLRSDIEELLQRLVDGESVLQPSASTAQGRAPAAFHPFSALVADDNAVNREVAVEALSQLGGTVATAENGVEAVAALAEARYDIVFMDGSMPEMDGFEATRRIRETEAARGAPRSVIVALTAHVVGSAADAWRSAGMDDVLYKPFTMEKLARTIAKHVPRLLRDATAAAAAEETAPPAPRPDGPPLLDPAILRQLADLQANGKGDFVQKVFGLYLEHGPAATARIGDAARRGDLEECARAAHALKSMSYNIGARRAADHAGAIEKLARIDGALPGETILQALSDAMAATLTALANARGPTASPAATPADDMQQALAHAIERNELSLLYQPIVDRAGARTCGVEALLRWQPAGAEPISPAVFVPLAERTGLINPIGDWVMRRACTDAAAWPGLTLAVNVSPIQFAQPDLAERFERIVADCGFAWRRLELEITETALLEAEDAVMRVMERLGGLGANFALDDFGTGYSSLNYLRRFPFGKIKIDRAFISNIGMTVDATIVHAVVSIGRALGLKVVAEGVEEADQQRFLNAAGVHFMQGYRFARPLTADAVTERLRNERKVPLPGALTGP
ncbi:MAG: mmoS [Bradyrhizobiaceae bacterium]|nr:MAG: mmoS [Bradyrhizobiaceae bacterium]